MANEPVRSSGSMTISQVDVADEPVALVAGVVAGGVGELGAERVVDVGELGVVVVAEVHGEGVGDDLVALDVDVAGGVDLADEAPADLDRADAGLEDAAEHALHQVLESAFEAAGTHGRPRYRPAAVPLAPGRRSRWSGVGPVAKVGELVTRASGGIGRRGGFRFLCPKGRGGSSPPSPTEPNSSEAV